ncbi:hypothetical protein SAY86_016167 [Trapa natans]|uniref:Nascent polypeptide-associated complex subunit beta n=1 Tax=Trapa natans TaxID=22666 RepID=A0AAN7LJ33_TRANT|nr:hypothetical protein SAY86_016167 [Trapa natans]
MVSISFQQSICRSRSRCMSNANFICFAVFIAIFSFDLVLDFHCNLTYDLPFKCRKHKAVHKTTTTDDKKLQSTLKRIGVNAIPAIEEVNIFKDDVVIQFMNPKVQASIAANTWVVSGTPQTKSTYHACIHTCFVGVIVLQKFILRSIKTIS